MGGNKVRQLEHHFGQAASAIALAAQHDAILLDPVYSGRCFAGLIGLLGEGTIGQGQRETFIHTGDLRLRDGLESSDRPLTQQGQDVSGRILEVGE